jgi:hypothetical protein
LACVFPGVNAVFTARHNMFHEIHLKFPLLSSRRIDISVSESCNHLALMFEKRARLLRLHPPRSRIADG